MKLKKKEVGAYFQAGGVRLVCAGTEKGQGDGLFLAPSFPPPPLASSGRVKISTKKKDSYRCPGLGDPWQRSGKRKMGTCSCSGCWQCGTLTTPPPSGLFSRHLSGPQCPSLLSSDRASLSSSTQCFEQPLVIDHRLTFMLKYFGLSCPRIVKQRVNHVLI